MYYLVKFFFLLMLTNVSVFAQTAPDVQPKKEAVWSYDNDYTGQEEWGLITPAFAACGIGTEQSPVHIGRTEGIRADVPTFNYNSGEMRLQNIGYTFEIQPISELSYIEEGKTYLLKSIHFHTPSEHGVRGAFYPMEIQFNHESIEGKKLIIAVFTKIGAAQPELDIALSAVPEKYNVSNTIIFNPALLLPHSFAHYAYTGSITTPPCTEGIQWRIMKKHITISQEQMFKVAKFTRRNARLAQPLYMRTVKEVN